MWFFSSKQGQRGYFKLKMRKPKGSTRKRKIIWTLEYVNWYKGFTTKSLNLHKMEFPPKALLSNLKTESMRSNCSTKETKEVPQFIICCNLFSQVSDVGDYILQHLPQGQREVLFTFYFRQIMGKLQMKYVKKKVQGPNQAIIAQ